MANPLWILMSIFVGWVVVLFILSEIIVANAVPEDVGRYIDMSGYAIGLFSAILTMASVRLYLLCRYHQ